MSDQPYQDTLHFLNGHVYMLNHTPVEHPCRHIPPTTFLLQGVETLQDDTFPVGQTVSNIREIVTRVMSMYSRASPCRHAEVMATMLVWASGYTVANSGRHFTTPRVHAKAPS